MFTDPPSPLVGEGKGRGVDYAIRHMLPLFVSLSQSLLRIPAPATFVHPAQHKGRGNAMIGHKKNSRREFYM